MVPTGCHPLAERSELLEQAELLKQWPPLRRQHLEDQTALDGEALAEVVDGHIIQIADRSAVHIEQTPAWSITSAGLELKSCIQPPRAALRGQLPRPQGASP